SRGYLLTAETDADRILPVPYDEISTHTMLPASHILWAGAWLGMARSAVDSARRYVRDAAQRSIGTQPAGATALVVFVAQPEEPQLSVADAARDFDTHRDDPAALEAVGFRVRMNTLKVTASEALARIAAEALRITGIAGFRNDGPYSVARVFRDAQGAAL